MHLDLHTVVVLLCVCFVDDIYLFDIILGCTHEQKALMGVRLIGVAIKYSVFDAEIFKTYFIMLPIV